MKQKLPTRRMHEHTDLEQLELQAKQLLSSFKAGELSTIKEVNAHYDNAQAANFALHHARLVVARSYGFDNWPKLKAYVDGITIRHLVDAVRGGDIDHVRAMLMTRPELANMSVSYGDEHRAIHYAVMHRYPEIVRVLMQNGANARVGIHPHRDATSAWTLAHERGYDDIVAIIEEEEERRARPAPARASTPVQATDEIERAAVASGGLNACDVNVGGSFGRTILHEIAAMGDWITEDEVAAFGRTALEAGARTNGRDTILRSTPLGWACRWGRLQLVRLLIEHGADPAERDAEMWARPRSWAQKMGHLEIVKALD